MLKNKKLILGIVLVFALGLVSFLVLKAPLFKLQFINISGTSKYVSATDVYNLLQENYKGVPLISIKSSQVKDRLLKTFLAISDVQVRKVYPNTLDVLISERQPLVVVCTSQDQSYLVSKDGYVLGEVSEVNQPLPKVQFEGAVYVGQFMPPGFLDKYSSLLEALHNSDVSASEVKLHDTYAVFYTERGVKVLLPFNKPFDTSLKELDSILSVLYGENKHPLVIDLRYDKVVVSY